MVIHAETVWATAKLGAISRANGGAIILGCRSAVIGDGDTTVFRKHGGQAPQVGMILKTRVIRIVTGEGKGGHRRLTTLLAIFDTSEHKVPSVAEVQAIHDGHVVRVHIADR